MSALAARAAMSGFARLFPGAMRFMARNPGLGGRVLRSGSRALRGAAVGAGAGMNALKTIQRLIKEKTKKPVMLKKATKALQKYHAGAAAPAVKKRKMLRNVTQGRYGGKIKMKKPYDPYYEYHRNGIVVNVEGYGTGTDTEALYLQTVSVTPIELIKYIVKALVRKLLEKGGMVINSVNEKLSGTNYHVPDVFHVVTLTLSTSTGVTNLDSAFVSTSTLETVCAVFYQTFIDYCSGNNNASGAGVAANISVPVTFTYKSTGVGATLLSQIDITAAHLKVYCRNVIKIQNRTKSADIDTSEDQADDVSNQPIHARGYWFSGLPRTKSHPSDDAVRDNQFFGQYPVDKIARTILGSTLNVELREPVSVKSFWNCKKEANFVIQPGEIKNYHLYDVVKWQTVLGFLKKLRLQYATSTNAYETNYFPMNTCLFGFEEMIQSDSANNLRIAYEVESKVGVQIRFKRSRFVRSQVSTVNLG